MRDGVLNRAFVRAGVPHVVAFVARQVAVADLQASVLVEVGAGDADVADLTGSDSAPAGRLRSMRFSHWE